MDVEGVLRRVFPVTDIRGRLNDKIYLTRFWLLGSKASDWALMLHKMHSPDDHACHHDHPWAFWTFVLYGGYVEEVTQPWRPIALPGDHRETTVQFNDPGTLLHRKAEHTHRIAGLPKGTCWTLVFRTKKERKWGFFTKEGWIAWEGFLDKVHANVALWCGTDDE